MTRRKIGKRRWFLVVLLVIAAALGITASTEGGRQLLRAQWQRVVDKFDGTAGRWLDRRDNEEAVEQSRRDAEGKGMVFLHHSCGNDWLSSGLHQALLDTDYLDTVQSITYGVDVEPMEGRPDSLQQKEPPGNYTDMRHWLLWFNDYLQGVQSFGRPNGNHGIVMFKSCFPNSNIAEHEDQANPFSALPSVDNYQAVFRHPDGASGTYRYQVHDYRALEQIFAAHPETLFVVVTAPPRHFGPPDATTDEEATRARSFNHWLENDWLAAYNAAHPHRNNVGVYNWFERLAYPPEHPHHPGRLMYRFGGSKNDSHPNRRADKETTPDFIQWLDATWANFTGKK